MWAEVCLTKERDDLREETGGDVRGSAGGRIGHCGRLALRGSVGGVCRREAPWWLVFVFVVVALIALVVLLTVNRKQLDQFVVLMPLAASVSVGVDKVNSILRLRMSGLELNFGDAIIALRHDLTRKLVWTEIYGSGWQRVGSKNV